MSCSSSSGSEDDDEGFDSYRKGGYHAVRIGDQFAGGRYVAQRKLGWGQFSTVWLAYDTTNSTYVALKIQKSAAQFAQAALHEIQILTAIAEGDSSDLKCVVRLIDHFKHAGPNGQHLCMVLEFLGDSLLRLIKYNRYKGLKLDNVREICKCILMGLDYLHREVGIIHTDLKPENILLFNTIDPTKDPIRSKVTPIIERPEGGLNGGVTMSLIEKKLKRRARRAVAKISLRRESMGGGEAPKSERNMDGVDVRCKVVDFGNACWADKQLAEEIQTRQYRAPEVILRSGYTYSVDMWSFACTAFELATGDMLFAPKMGEGFSEDEDHLALMMELLGKMPRKVAIGGARSKDFFDRHGDLKRIRRLKFWPLNKILVDRYNFSETDAREFAEFLCPIFDFSPEKRPTAQQCLQHPWLNGVTTSQGDANNISSVEKVNVGMSNLQIKVGK
ncbi:PREDICTED: probable serine/threonine-protein kinase sky1 [Fragaria vesca subsp. vesca]|uniref:probable serine/threonine-protein kinase sky1 n=1 Tax=Fragaria vesca subsp. vesca TaxID=101020 RepID=UPI0002C31934|nr:PREDICTED: probable serine/threonine-protein kinase sky1 [Fragaria vesca subsp. vesca]